MNAQRTAGRALMLSTVALLALALVPAEALAFQPTNVRKPNNDGGIGETSYEWEVEPARSKSQQPDPFHTAPSSSPPSKKDDGGKVE